MMRVIIWLLCLVLFSYAGYIEDEVENIRQLLHILVPYLIIIGLPVIVTLMIVIPIKFLGTSYKVTRKVVDDIIQPREKDSKSLREKIWDEVS